MKAQEYNKESSIKNIRTTSIKKAEVICEKENVSLRKEKARQFDMKSIVLSKFVFSIVFINHLIHEKKPSVFKE